MGNFYIGLMSGTSTDGVDAVLADIDANGKPIIIGHSFIAMPNSLRQQFLSLNQPSTDEIHQAAIAGNELAKLYAKAVKSLLTQHNLNFNQVIALGAHGQTVRHAPHLGYSTQINNPALLSELTSINVIADFRSSDIAAGGHGAPLVPAFHKNIFAKNSRNTVVLNLGGIANITVLHNDKKVIGFDTGPANILLDAWANQHIQQSYDKDGAWAKSGKFNDKLLDFLIDSEPWFNLQPPKSTGRDLFNLKWLDCRLNQFFKADSNAYKPQDIQATLLHLTAKTVIDSISRFTYPNTNQIIVCGGGAFNKYLIQTLSQYADNLFKGCDVFNCEQIGIAPDQVEALAFAWLAWAYENRKPANLPDVTGAKGLRILGCKYLAS